MAVAPTVCFEPAGGRFGAGAAYAMEFVCGTAVAPRVLRRDELAIARERLPGQLAAALAQELIDYCRTQLASLKCPRSIDFRDELPRLPTGKLYKRLLRDEYWGDKTSRIV